MHLSGERIAVGRPSTFRGIASAGRVEENDLSLTTQLARFVKRERLSPKIPYPYVVGTTRVMSVSYDTVAAAERRKDTEGSHRDALRPRGSIRFLNCSRETNTTRR